MFDRLAELLRGVDPRKLVFRPVEMTVARLALLDEASSHGGVVKFTDDNKWRYDDLTFLYRKGFLAGVPEAGFYMITDAGRSQLRRNQP